jgi:hypothetical protein
MPLTRETLEKRAIKAGIKASKKRRHVISSEELLALRVQTMPAFLRVFLVLLGILLIAAAWSGWPPASNAIQGLEVLGGIFAILFGAFGIRRTLSRIIDSVDGIEITGHVLKVIVEAVSCIDL